MITTSSRRISYMWEAPAVAREARTRPNASSGASAHKLDELAALLLDNEDASKERKLIAEQLHPSLLSAEEARGLGMSCEKWITQICDANETEFKDDRWGTLLTLDDFYTMLRDAVFAVIFHVAADSFLPDAKTAFCEAQPKSGVEAPIPNQLSETVLKCYREWKDATSDNMNEARVLVKVNHLNRLLSRHISV